MKVKHAGYRTVRTMDGHEYSNCDVLVLYDINQNASGVGGNCMQAMIEELARAEALKANTEFKPEEIEDLEITLVVKQGVVPVLGAVKLDVKGKYNGMNLKAGADYLVSPTN